MTRFFRWPLLFLTLCLLSTCTHLPRNGWLDGQWQLVKQNGEDMKPQRIYWRFQLDLMELYSPTIRLETTLPYTHVLCRFAHEGQQLTLSSTYLALRGEGRDTLITPQMHIDLSPLGVRRIPTTFRILSSSSQTMTLESDNEIWELRHF